VNGRIAVILFVALSAASCAGDGVLDTGTNPPPSDGPTLSALQASIFTPRCALPGCHAAPTPQQGMELSAGHTYASTVGVDSAELSGFKRVAPGNGLDSYVVMKVSADPRIVGDRMPDDRTTLTAAEIDAIRAWIDAGAPNN
jgi:hypothetical protein